MKSFAAANGAGIVDIFLVSSLLGSEIPQILCPFLEAKVFGADALDYSFDIGNLDLILLKAASGTTSNGNRL
jgi:hypothetical protein